MTPSEISKLENDCNLAYSHLKHWLINHEASVRQKARITRLDSGTINKIQNGKLKINSIKLNRLLTALLGLTNSTTGK